MESAALVYHSSKGVLHDLGMAFQGDLQYLYLQIIIRRV
jgi:hypothetical protein